MCSAKANGTVMETLCPFESGWRRRTTNTRVSISSYRAFLHEPYRHSENDERNPEKVCFVIQTGEEMQPPLWKLGISHPLSATRNFCVLPAWGGGGRSVQIHTEQLEEKHWGLQPPDTGMWCQAKTEASSEQQILHLHVHTHYQVSRSLAMWKLQDQDWFSLHCKAKK